MPCNYDKYPPNWKSEIVPRILKRAGNKCEKCGLVNHTLVKSGKLYTRQTGGYKYRTLWFAHEGDFIRAKSLLCMIKNVYVVLTVAHLDHDETNHDVKDERLRAWCQKCHLEYDAKEKYQRACLGKGKTAKIPAIPASEKSEKIVDDLIKEKMK